MDYLEKILVLDNDQAYANIIGDLLVTHDYDVSYCSNVKDLSKDLAKNSYELIIFDPAQQMADTSSVIEWKALYPRMEVIVLASGLDDKDEVAYLKLGVCDYVSKKGSYAVIVERIKRCIHGKEEMIAGIKVIEGTDGNKIKIDTKTQIITINGVIKHLTQLELDLLLYFISNPNKVLSREEILRDVWKFPGDDLDLDTRTIDVHVKNLRRKLGIKNIYSIRGLGYRWYEKAKS